MSNRIKLPPKGDSPSFNFLQNFTECLRRSKTVFICMVFLVSAQLLSAQVSTVHGKVTSGDSALPNVTVTVKGLRTATQTDLNGNFTIQAAPNATLVVTAIGYAAQEVKVNNRMNFSVLLESSTKQLDQVVVVGYGTQKKRI